MFSASGSYLGAQSQRPGQPGQQPYGGTSFNPQGQQPQGFQPQPTGFGQQPLQQQFTGFPGQLQQPMQQQPQQSLQLQPTGFPGSQTGQFGAPQQQQQSYQPPPMPPQPTQAPAPIQSQPTGFSQMAASFTGAPAQPKGRRQPKTTTKIPNIRLSFITAKDQAQFETLFKSAVGDTQSMSGEKAREILLRSNLDGESLSQIWYYYILPVIILLQL